MEEADHRRIRRRCVDELGRNKGGVLRRRCLRGIFQTGPRGEYSADFTLSAGLVQGAPFEDTEGFRSRSAITFVDKIKTPMMFILGEADHRTPPGASELFRALKYRKIPTVMVRFPNEGHELSRSGQPWHRVERLQHIVGWFDKWMMGVSKPEYEVAVDKYLGVDENDGDRSGSCRQRRPTLKPRVK